MIYHDFIGKEIEPYSPLSKTMCLLDKILGVETEQFLASVKISEASPFYQHGGVPAWIGIEYMAQAIAARAGVLATIRGEPIKIGFLLGSRNYKAKVHSFEKGEVLAVSVREVLIDPTGLAVYDCQISLDGNELASAKLNVFQPDNPEQFIEEQKND